jgi:hypothetical protein
MGDRREVLYAAITYIPWGAMIFFRGQKAAAEGTARRIDYVK